MSTEQSFYLRHERAILGSAMVLIALLAWEGLERGWWADVLHPILGESAERLHIERIFISSPTLVAGAAFRMFFVTGEIWREIAWSSLGYGLGLALAIAIGIPLGLAAGIGVSPTPSIRFCRHSMPRRRSPSCRSSWSGSALGLAPAC
jgi:ABC-type nitrate/sulfonate/bicarbonate transport system permease component